MMLNKLTSNTSASALATPAIDWSEIIDGQDGLYKVAADLKIVTHLLMVDLENGLDFQRGRPTGGKAAGLVEFTFTQDSIDATQWLAGRAWHSALNLIEKLEAVQHKLDAADQGAS